MSIGLIPLKYDEYNYGGVLQFYALQKVLSKNDKDVCIIKVEAERNICTDGKTPSKSLKSTIVFPIVELRRRWRRCGITKNIKKRRNKIDLFKKRFYAKTVQWADVDASSLEAVICGSDQIWNPNFARERAFLTFVPDKIKKIIYAASLGVEELTEEQKSAYKPLIERLDHVSVREYSAEKILSTFVKNVDIMTVLDPTLLLSKKDWDELALESCIDTHDEYILMYFLGEYAHVTSMIGTFAKSKGLKIINIPFASGEKYDKVNFGDKQILDADPSDFISLIKNAQYVFTDSFHACVFSIIYKKQFYVVERDGKKDMMGRIETLFKNFNIPSRVISPNTFIEKCNIDYTDIELRQLELQKKSLDFLLGGLNGKE